MFRFKSWMQIESQASVGEVSPAQTANAVDTIISKGKYDYLLSQQINLYMKRKNRKYDFLEIGEKEEFTIL